MNVKDSVRKKESERRIEGHSLKNHELSNSLPSVLNWTLQIDQIPTHNKTSRLAGQLGPLKRNNYGSRRRS